MSFNNKRLGAFIVLFAILDSFVTYHSFWQRLVVIAAISSVTHFFYVWGKEET